MKQMRNSNGRRKSSPPSGLDKAPTGIRGLDDISAGGLPRGRTTIVCGGPGCGKTMLGLEFLVRGVEEFGEPGVLVAFEETPEEMARNVASLGFDLNALCDKKKLFLDYMRIEPSEIHETGDYDLEGLFIRLQNAVDSVGAKRVVLDTLEALFSGFSNLAVLRAEIRRLFRWLKDRGLTTVVTAEQGSGTLTRHGLEEYVSDCVILLDHRIQEQISTRRLRIVKYRGTKHGADEYPFLIDESGLSVLPLTSLMLNHKVSKRTHFHRDCRSRRHVGRQWLLSREHDSCERYGGQRKNHVGLPLCRGLLLPRRALPLHRVRRIHRPVVPKCSLGRSGS